MATPPFFITVHTSAKSTMICPLLLMISVIHLAAVANTLSAFPKASFIFKSPYCTLNLSLLITNKVSTNGFSCLMPSSACSKRRGPSKPKGVVTIPTVKIPRSLQIWAIIGAPPVPVPPPIPTVINAILVLTSSIRLISSNDSSVAFFPTSGFAPAPKPCVRCGPNCILLGIRLCSIALASVLQMIKSTPSIFCSNMKLTALLPPPPTPRTLMIEDFCLGRSK